MNTFLRYEIYYYEYTVLILLLLLNRTGNTRAGYTKYNNIKYSLPYIKCVRRQNYYADVEPNNIGRYVRRIIRPKHSYPRVIYCTLLVQRPHL